MMTNLLAGQVRADSKGASSRTMVYLVLFAMICAFGGAVGYKYVWPKVKTAQAINYRGMRESGVGDEASSLDVDLSEK